MPQAQVPAYVDTRKVFLQETEITGVVQLERLPRFRQLLTSDQGEVRVALKFWIDDFGQQLITGHLHAQVEVACQRCLEPLEIELADDIKLALLRDESKLKSLDDDLDPWICDEIKLDLANLVEEQLMLCMPIVSYHDGGNCLDRSKYSTAELLQADQVEQETKRNPFAVLKTLKE